MVSSEISFAIGSQIEVCCSVPGFVHISCQSRQVQIHTSLIITDCFIVIIITIIIIILDTICFALRQ